MADSSASIIVSGIILFALIPLLIGMARSFHELRGILRDETSDREMEYILQQSRQVKENQELEVELEERLSLSGEMT